MRHDILQLRASHQQVLLYSCCQAGYTLMPPFVDTDIRYASVWMSYMGGSLQEAFCSSSSSSQHLGAPPGSLSLSLFLSLLVMGRWLYMYTHT